jgi:3-isopropylmalate dehydratase small subunit
VYLASPETAAASAVAGAIATKDAIPDKPAVFEKPKAQARVAAVSRKAPVGERPTKVTGRVWRIAQDNIDTDMIYHNRHLTVTDLNEMGQYAFGNLEGWDDFAKKVKPGDVIVTGKNFGCGSSRQQAVDCFQALGVAAIVAESFGAIYERNAINAGFAIMTADTSGSDIQNGEEVELDFKTGRIRRPASGKEVSGTPVSEAQLAIYQRGGLFAG